jgi:hypothetical protein
LDFFIFFGKIIFFLFTNFASPLMHFTEEKHEFISFSPVKKNSGAPLAPRVSPGMRPPGIRLPHKKGANFA